MYFLFCSLLFIANNIVVSDLSRIKQLDQKFFRFMNLILIPFSIFVF